MDRILKDSILSCNAYDKGGSYKCDYLYPFTTENISGYINLFDLENKSLLTVGSSGDQVINAALYNCTDITLYDIVPTSRYFYFLKVAGLISLSKDEFIEFFKFTENYGRKNNLNVFNISTFYKLKPTLKNLDEDSYLFFTELFDRFSGLTIRRTLFYNDEDNINVVERCNAYLSSNINYGIVKEKIKYIYPKFICADILDIDDNIKYDNIWLSNIATRIRNMDVVLKMINKTYACLNEDGKLLISYLYKTNPKTRFISHYAPIYNINEVFELLNNYNVSLNEFDGVKFDSDNIYSRKDSVLILKK